MDMLAIECCMGIVQTLSGWPIKVVGCGVAVGVMGNGRQGLICDIG